MASTYSPSLKLELIGSGDQSGTWGTTTNNNLGTLLEQAITGVQDITMINADYVLTNYNGTSDEARNAVLVVGGTNSAIRQVIAPLVEKPYVITNNTSGGYAITIGGVSGATVTIPNGITAQVYCNGTNFYSSQTGSAGNFTVNGTLTATGLTDTGNMSVTGTLGVTGATSLTTGSISGVMTAPTAAAGTNTTQLATTAFVQTATGTLGTMASQNANAVAITGGTLNGVTGTNAGMTVGTATNATNATNATLSTNSTNALGYSQTWQNVTSSRSFSTTYTNSTGKPIQVYFTANGAGLTAGVGFTLLLNGTLAFTDGFGVGSSSCAIQIVIPAGNTYSIYQSAGGAYSGSSWYELRQ